MSRAPRYFYCSRDRASGCIEKIRQAEAAVELALAFLVAELAADELPGDDAVRALVFFAAYIRAAERRLAAFRPDGADTQVADPLTDRVAFETARRGYWIDVVIVELPDASLLLSAAIAPAIVNAILIGLAFAFWLFRSGDRLEIAPSRRTWQSTLFPR